MHIGTVKSSGLKCQSGSLGQACPVVLLLGVVCHFSSPTRHTVYTWGPQCQSRRASQTVPEALKPQNVSPSQPWHLTLASASSRPSRWAWGQEHKPLKPIIRSVENIDYILTCKAGGLLHWNVWHQCNLFCTFVCESVGVLVWIPYQLQGCKEVEAQDMGNDFLVS